MVSINLSCDIEERKKAFYHQVAEKGIIHDESALFLLKLTSERLELHKIDEPKLGAIYVDFVSGAVAHRRKYGGGKSQAIAKAVGLNKGVTPHILDATAGLGRDAFVFASLGCQVTMLERHPVVACLLEDGLNRAKLDSEIGQWVNERLSLSHASSLNALMQYQDKVPDVIYLDPMFPHPTQKKSALVKKEMRVFQTLVGSDLDADELLEPALALATKRVVVKRPDYAPHLNNLRPSFIIETKKNRFDIYVNDSMSLGEK